MDGRSVAGLPLRVPIEGAELSDRMQAEPIATPTVSIVYNRCDELRESLQRMLTEGSYDPERLDVIVSTTPPMTGRRRWSNTSSHTERSYAARRTAASADGMTASP